MLQAHGEFHPFGAAILSDGVFNAVGGYPGEHAPGAEVFTLLRDAFKGQFEKKEISAAAIAANVNIPVEFEPKYPDGIRVLIECSGYSRFVYLPYRLIKPGLIGRWLGEKARCEYHDFITVDVEPILCTQSSR